MNMDEWAKEFQEAIRVAVKQLSAAMLRIEASRKVAREARTAALSPEQRERLSQARYRAAVAGERAAGRAWVAREVREMEASITWLRKDI